MKKIALLAVAGLSLAVGVSGTQRVSAAESMPSSKATAAVGNLQVLTLAAGEPNSWQTISTTQLKTSNFEDLFVDVSLQSSVFTQTEVRSKNMTKDTSTAGAGVKVRVLVDGEAALPGADGVIFNDRYQELSATLQGQLDWADSNGDGNIDTIGVVDYESIELILRTISANSFNFVYPNLASGIHTVEVQVMTYSGSSAQNGTASANATALIGAGSITVEGVRMVQNNTAELQ